MSWLVGSLLSELPEKPNSDGDKTNTSKSIGTGDIRRILKTAGQDQH